MPEITPAERRALRARAHALHPVAAVSQHGLSESVLAEIERSLKAHELIKVRVFGTERDARAALMAEICAKLAAAPVQHIGNILVIYREKAEEKKPAPAAKAKPKAGTKPRPKSKPNAPAKPAAPRRRAR
jgi:putative YhbY family RNA-binding protein